MKRLHLRIVLTTWALSAGLSQAQSGTLAGASSTLTGGQSDSSSPVYSDESLIADTENGVTGRYSSLYAAASPGGALGPPSLRGERHSDQRSSDASASSAKR